MCGELIGVVAAPRELSRREQQRCPEHEQQHAAAVTVDWCDAPLLYIDVISAT